MRVTTLRTGSKLGERSDSVLVFRVVGRIVGFGDIELSKEDPVSTILVQKREVTDELSLLPDQLKHLVFCLPDRFDSGVKVDQVKTKSRVFGDLLWRPCGQGQRRSKEKGRQESTKGEHRSGDLHLKKASSILPLYTVSVSEGT